MRKQHSIPPLPLWIYIAVVTTFSACGLFENEQDSNLLTVTTISAVEAMLEIHAGRGDNISIERDGNQIFSFRMATTDTLLTDKGLKPTTSYIWKAENFGKKNIQTAQATTLDTTSSNFKWETFSFGDHSSSVLYGVSIVDENNIWAVGEVFMNDSLGNPEEIPYNILHWNGENWKPIRLKYNCRLYFPNCGPVTELFARATSVKAYSSNDVWITAGSLHHFDGNTWTQYAGEQGIGNSNNIWGNNPNKLWFAGNNGLLINKSGQTWQEIKTETDLDFYDIHGNPEQGVVAVAAKRSESRDKMILRIKDNLQTESLPTDPIPFSISGIWFDESGVTYLVGSGLFLKPDINSSAPWEPIHKNITPYYLEAIAANGLNDIVTVGAFGEFLHFNGARWTSFQQIFDGNLLGDVAIKGNIIVAVGFQGSQAFIAVGKRE